MKKSDIKNYTFSGLESILKEKGQPPYRAKQVFQWLFKRGACSFGQMTNLPKEFIHELGNSFFISVPDCAEKQTSKDSTIKLLFRLDDSACVETVVIHAKNRSTICLSTQAGCRFRCAFCASGMKGFSRNLSVSEILNQILYVRDVLKIQTTNYVFMGMGEPLDNYENLVNAMNIMNDERGLNIGARRITVSTCGIAPGIKKLSNLNMQVNLSLSLHAVTDAKRDRLMPINKRFPIKMLIGVLSDYLEKTNRKITLEYILIPGINDESSDADDLARIARLLRAKINLIPYSEVSGLRFTAPTMKDLELFLGKVKGRHEHITLRQSKGKDIQAACGQLAPLQICSE
jgi:23S rRNA (adenine2503-C2)-methyltransferase